MFAVRIFVPLCPRFAATMACQLVNEFVIVPGINNHVILAFAQDAEQSILAQPQMNGDGMVSSII